MLYGGDGEGAGTSSSLLMLLKPATETCGYLLASFCCVFAPISPPPLSSPFFLSWFSCVHRKLLQALCVANRVHPSTKMAMGLDGLFEREVRHDGIALCLASLRTYYMAATDAEVGAASEPEPVLTEAPETPAIQAPVSDLQAPTDLEAPTVGVADLLEAWRARLVSPSSSVPHEVVEPKPAVAKAAAAEAEAGAAEAAPGSSEPSSVLDEVRAQLVAERVRRQQCEAELVALGRQLDRQSRVAERGIRELQGEVARLQERAAVKEQAYAVEERARWRCSVEGSQQSQPSAPQIPRPQAAEQESVQDGLRDREALARIGTALFPPMDLLWQTSRSSTEGLPPCGPRDSASSPRHASETYDGQDRREHVGLGLPRLFVYATWVAIGATYAATIYATLAWLSVAPQTEALDTQLE